MGFAIAFDLRNLLKRLPLCSGMCIFEIYLLACERFNDGEHNTVAQVTVMCDSEHLPCNFFCVIIHPLAQVARVIAAKRLEGRKRLLLAGSAGVVPENHYPMQVVATGVGRPLISNRMVYLLSFKLRIKRSFNGVSNSYVDRIFY